MVKDVESDMDRCESNASPVRPSHSLHSAAKALRKHHETPEVCDLTGYEQVETAAV